MPSASERILNSAIAVFSEHGYAGASTREIALRANVHQPAIAYHFKNKEQLWKEAVNSIWNQFLVELEKNMNNDAHLNDDERIDKFVDFYLRFTAKSPQVVTMVIQESAQIEGRGAWFNHTWLAPLAKILSKVLTGSEDTDDDKKFEQRALSLLSILTGSTRIFAQQKQMQYLLDIDTCSPNFINCHIKNVALALKAIIKAN